MRRAYNEQIVEHHENVEQMNSAIVEYVQGMPLIKAFNMSAVSFQKYSESIQHHLDIATNWNRKSGIQSSLLRYCLDLGLLFILPMGLYLLLKGELDWTALILFLVMGVGLLDPLNRAITAAGMINQIFEGSRRIQQLFDQSPLPTSKKQAIPHNHDIEFRRVDFHYGDNKIIDNVSYHLPQGSLTAVVGPSGAGKTTMVQLIPRFRDVTGGEILIGGVNIKEIRPEALMEKVSFVFQDVFLQNDTVMENIRMGSPDATEQEVMAAAQTASAHEFIVRLPQGYQTNVGEDGEQLSGGERQRLAIARAVLKDAPILILDEATSYADPENEKRIQDALRELMKNKTVVVVAHRLATLARADQILLFDKGVLRAAGRHEQMMQHQLYRRLWEDRSQAENWSLGYDD
jgi:ATP-binding cassette subfamily B protein